MDRKTATIHHIIYIRVTELRRHMIVLIWNSGKHIDANKPRCALTKVIKIGHYNSSVVCHCFLYLGRRLIESHVLFQKLNLSKYCCKLSFCGSYMELSGALKRHKKRHYTLYGIMYSQPVIIAKYPSFMTLWWGLFRDNDHLTVHYLAYYAGTHQISEYTENKYRLRLKLFYQMKKYQCLLHWLPWVMVNYIVK